MTQHKPQTGMALLPIDVFRAAFLLPVYLTGGLMRGTRAWARASLPANLQPTTRGHDHEQD